MNRQFEIVVVGGGMTGLTIAALLAHGEHRDQLRITVVDAGKRPMFDSSDDVSLRVSAIASGSTKILASIGAWQGILDQRACPYRDMRVWDTGGFVDGPDTLRFEAAEFAVS